MNRRIYPYTAEHHQPIYQYPTYPQSQPNYNLYEQAEQQTPFDYYAKPNQPTEWPNMIQQGYYPYTGQMQQSNPPPSLLAQFQTKDGQMDLQKMLSTVGQLANTVQQVSPVIKEIGAMINVFRKP